MAKIVSRKQSIVDPDNVDLIVDTVNDEDAIMMQNNQTV